MEIIKKLSFKPIHIILLVVLFVLIYTAGVYNNLIKLNEVINESWSQVENVYQRRSDLIPNLVETVKGYAKHEKETLNSVIEARSKATSIDTKDLQNNPQSFQAFQESQANLTSSLSMLLLIVERYPDLKANKNFLELQSQLEGTENRIAVERKRYNESVKQYNTTLMLFPGNVIANIFGFHNREYFKAESTAKTAPKVTF